MGGKHSNVGDWCILRTNGSRTVALAQSLTEAGFDAWTPTEMQSRRRPRSKERVQREMPIAPTFVFARACHLADLMRIRMFPASPHPSFSVFRHSGRVPLIADREIGGMRAEEERAKLKTLRETRRVFPTGERVRVPNGSFAGMTGVVKSADGKFALINFGGGFEVKIASWLLESDVLQGTNPKQGTAALAA